jgi:3'(2'), 5'-bisphosphate nucleotidase
MSRAGKILLDNYDNPSGVETKPDGTLVTEVDKMSSDLIISTLIGQFPEYGILDEEGGGISLDRQRVWVVDPLDGTKEYVEKTGDFGMIIGLVDGEDAVLGITYKPQTGEMVYAARGQGAYLLRNGISTPLGVRNDDSIDVLVSRSRSCSQLDSMLSRIKPNSVTPMGGSLKTIEIAKGKATLFLCPPESRMHLWDLCAPSVILEEAGGRITDAYGQAFDYRASDTANYRGVVAANGSIHELVLKRIAGIF